MGALILRRDSVLLIERGREPHKGCWSLPGGVVEAGELLADAVRREALEETGLAVKPVSVVEIFERIMRDRKGRPEYHYVLIDYLCRVRRGELRAADDASRAAWVRRKDVPSYRLTEGLLDVIEKAFRQRAESR